MIVVGEILHLKGSFQGALGLDNYLRYRCNRPRLYLTEEHSIGWKFCLVNQKLFHLIWSASENQSVQTQRRRNPIRVKFFRSIVAFTFFFNHKRSVQKCTEESFHNVRKCTEETISKVIWVGTGALDAILNQINKKIGDQFHFQ